MQRKITNALIVIMLLALFILAGSFYFFNLKESNLDTKPTINNGGKKENNLRSFFNNKDEYDKAFSAVGNNEKKEILAGITSHHFLAKDLIARFYSGIENTSVEKVIIVGPDHYGKLSDKDTDVVMTEISWDTPFGELNPDKDLMQKILKNNARIGMNEDVFKIEHAVYTEIPFIKKVFTQAEIMPMIVKNNYSYEEFVKIGEKLRKTVGENALIIVSSDFSHEATVEEAKTRDDLSIMNLQDFRFDNLDNINCDCRACMAVLLGFLGPNAKNFYLVENKNSSNFGSPDEKVTSYISGYFLSD